MGLYDSIDLKWTWDGDYVVGDDGDIGDTSDDTLTSLEQELATVVKSDALDWEKDPFLGASLADFVGEANKRETGKRIQERVLLAIGAANIVQAGDVQVRVVPVGLHQLMIMVSVTATWSANNRLNVADAVSVNVLFDTAERDLFFFPTRNEPF